MKLINIRINIQLEILKLARCASMFCLFFFLLSFFLVQNSCTRSVSSLLSSCKSSTAWWNNWPLIENKNYEQNYWVRKDLISIFFFYWVCNKNIKKNMSLSDKEYYQLVSGYWDFDAIFAYIFLLFLYFWNSLSSLIFYAEYFSL